MSVVSCPRCADSVVMPGGISAQATVRCPLCQEEFSLTEVLDSLPPALVVVNDPGAIQDTGSEPFSFVGSADEESPYELAEPESGSGTPSFSIASSAADTTPTGSGKRRRAAPRPQRKKKSPAMEVVKIVLGGIAGLTIAQLLLWWMPVSQWRRDPFKFGPKVAVYAPWIVPAQFEGKSAQQPADPDDTETPPPGSTQPAGRPPAAEGPGSGLPQRKFVDPNLNASQDPPRKKAKTGRSKQVSGNPSREPGDASEDTAEVVPNEPDGDDIALSPPDDIADSSDVGGGAFADLTLDPDLLDMIGGPSEDPEPADAGADLELDPAPAAEPASVQIAGVPQVTAAELRTALDEARNTSQAWLAAEDPNSRPLVSQSYRALAKLGEAVTFSNDVGEEDQTSISQTLASLAEDKGRLGNIRLLASHWPTYPQRDTAGVLLAGTVAETRQEGDLLVTDLVVTEGQDPVAVYGTAAPAGRYEKGAFIMLLGAIVEKPADRVPGYAGDADWLIWYGLSQPVSGN